MPFLEIFAPEQAEEIEEWVVVTWLKNEGDPFEKGDALVIVQAEKVSHEVEAPVAGTLVSILAKQGEVIPRDQPLGRIAIAEGAAVAPEASHPTEPAPSIPTAAPPVPSDIRASPIARRLAREHGVDLAQVQGSGREGRITEKDVQAVLDARAATVAAEPAPAARPAPSEIRASPVAKRIAREHGVDLSLVSGSGRGGRIVEEDVQSYLESKQPQPEKGAAEPAEKTVPLAGMRGAIAQRMHQSLQEMAQLTLFTEADVTELVTLREKLKGEYPLTYTDLILKACALALREHPRLNVTLDGDRIRLLADIHVGLAIALDEGLVVPVMRHTDTKTLPAIARERARLAERARSNLLTADEMEGGTFTVTNLGTYDIDGFTPIINPPEAAILGVGRIVEKVVVYQGKIAQRSMVVLSLSFDHRLVDGAPAAAFLQTVGRFLQQPDALR